MSMLPNSDRLAMPDRPTSRRRTYSPQSAASRLPVSSQTMPDYPIHRRSTQRRPDYPGLRDTAQSDQPTHFEPRRTDGPVHVTGCPPQLDDPLPGLTSQPAPTNPADTQRAPPTTRPIAVQLNADPTCQFDQPNQHDPSRVDAPDRHRPHRPLPTPTASDFTCRLDTTRSGPAHVRLPGTARYVSPHHRPTSRIASVRIDFPTHVSPTRTD